MSWCYRHLIRPLLFLQESEKAHDRTLQAMAWLSGNPDLLSLVAGWYDAPELPVRVFGLTFPNPVGLGAGMDKQAEALPMWRALGLGFCEIGGVTWHPQPGNPKPRMFRAIGDQALVNRMGFNNGGAEAMAATLTRWRDQGLWPAHPVGINLGKSKVTPNDRAVDDYAASFRLLRPLADFFVVNVSSPNTPNLRQLQDRSALDGILSALQEINQTGDPAHRRPLLVKVAPDLTFDALDEILSLAGERDLAGIIATNTTIQRPATEDSGCAGVYRQTGGLSGKPLRLRSTEVIRHIHRQTRGRLPIIGVGGIFTVDDAVEKILAGASLIQIYSGLVYEGPGLVRSLVSGLRTRLGGRDWQDFVGAGNRDSIACGPADRPLN